MNDSIAKVSWSVRTPIGTPGAIAIVELTADSREALNTATSTLRFPRVDVGSIKLADLLGVDRGVIARWSERTLHLMPHGGPVVLKQLTIRLAQAGLAPAGSLDPMLAYPEASSLIEARMLDTLARAASPLAIDLLLDQPRRWREHESGTLPRIDDVIACVLQRLIEPPLIVALGGSNIGKSTLVNALAGRGVSIVADEPGTTRDHVGVSLDLAGLVVRYVDTPGIRDGAPQLEQDALRLSLELASRADLILWCGDGASPPPRHDILRSNAAKLSVALRSDLGAAMWPHDLGVSAKTGAGLETLVLQIRERLVPQAQLDHPGAWAFWGDEPPKAESAPNVL
jgi:hypothetical protein